MPRSPETSSPPPAHKRFARDVVDGDGAGGHAATTTVEHPAAPPPRRSADRPPAAAPRRIPRPSPWLAALVPVVALSAVLNFNRLSQNGFANFFYSAGVKSELRSLHNFLFVSFDPGGFITIDKPPVALWVQVVSAKLFGFDPMSLLVPEALAGVLSVILMYFVVSRRFGGPAGIAAALVLAVFPSFVAVSRDNGVDPVLLLLMLAACATALRAVETGRWRWLIACAVVVGLAFNTKTLAALLIVPGIALAYFACGPRSLGRRAAQLLVAGVVMVVVSGAWIVYVDSVPASQRPFVGSSTNNTETNPTFDYNGVGRVDGQVGGPGRVPDVRTPPVPPDLPDARQIRLRSDTEVSGRVDAGAIPPGAAARAAVDGRVRALGAYEPPPAPRPAARPPRTRPAPRHVRAAPAVPKQISPGVEPIPAVGHAKEPSAFGGPTGPLRLWSISLGGQDGWILPLAFAGLLALGLTVRRRRDPKLATLIVFGGWLLCEAVVLSYSKGIVHPYYVSGLAPGAAAMVGAGVWAMAQPSRRLSWRLLLIPAAVASTVAVEIMLLSREHYLHAWIPYLVVGSVLAALIALTLPRWRAVPLAALLGLVLVAPAAYASTTWEIPTDGTFPVAGPHASGGVGGFGVSRVSRTYDLRLILYVDTHEPGSRWKVLTVASDTAAPIILMGTDATAIAGYSGDDPALNGPGLARLVARGEARYVLLGGAYSTRGGNAAITATREACRVVPSLAWRGVRGGGTNGLQLFDCRGREAQLTAAG